MVRGSDKLTAVVVALGRSLGLQASEARKLSTVEQRLFLAQAKNADRLEALKDRIRFLETQAVGKNREYKEARGTTKRILAGEVERLLRDVDRLASQARIVSANIDRLSIAQSKIEEIRLGEDVGFEEGELDDVAVRLEEVVAGLETADREVADLDKVRYARREKQSSDLEESVSAWEQEPEDVLSPEQVERLRLLEEEG